MANLVGLTLSNRYHIEESVGRGGMADVYKAWDNERATYLALKVLRQDLAQDAIFLRRFQREAHTLRQLQHPNIVRFYGIEREDLLVYMMMDFIDGTTLQAEIFRSQGHPLNQVFINQCLQSICSALHYAHGLGLVHCDIKPGNIMINQHGDILLTDFGIARMTDAATSTMVGFGTPAYIAPELVQGKDPTPSSDIYSLGVILYEMSTGGERPFTGERAQTTGMTSEKVRWEQVHLSPSSPRLYNPTIPSSLDEVIMKCLAKNPGDRFNSALELLGTVERALPGQLNQQVQPNKTALSSARQGQQKLANLDAGVGVRPTPSKHTANVKINSATPKATQNNTRIATWVVMAALLLIVLVIGIALLSTDSTGPSFTSMQAAQTAAALNAIPEPGGAQEDLPLAIQNDAGQPAIEAIPEPMLGVGSSTINEKDGAVMVYVPAGQFLMGSEDEDALDDEQPERMVYVDAFWVYQTEVTNTQFADFVAETGYQTHAEEKGNSSILVENIWIEEPGANWLEPTGIGSSIFDKGNHPVVHVSWNDANVYCQWAGGRLPTEAEWEKAARSSDGRKYPWGNNEVTGERANYCDINCPLNFADTRQDDGYAFTAPVGNYLAGQSDYGALDMSGNVLEWVADWYEEDYYSKAPDRNPTGPEQGFLRVLRGGSWNNREGSLRVTSRNANRPDYSISFIGFRCVSLP